MSNRAVLVSELVQAVRGAVAQDVARGGGDPGLVVTEVELEVKATLRAGADGRAQWYALSAGARVAREEVQTFRLAWVRTAEVRLRESTEVQYQLITGLDALYIGLGEWTAAGPLPFRPRDARLCLHLVALESGELRLAGMGTRAAREHTHLVTLTLGPRPDA
ncbi:trypco2 family protein [Deinococcus petrolearius]|uniref:Trypco2 family protein n=1 Tax=Deinococcus petrolearius TaxID=1751295 RepID=A0ABW1DFP1_9DEIO